MRAPSLPGILNACLSCEKPSKISAKSRFQPGCAEGALRQNCFIERVTCLCGSPQSEKTRTIVLANLTNRALRHITPSCVFAGGVFPGCVSAGTIFRSVSRSVSLGICVALLLGCSASEQGSEAAPRSEQLLASSVAAWNAGQLVQASARMDSLETMAGTVRGARLSCKEADYAKPIVMVLRPKLVPWLVSCDKSLSSKE